MALKIRDAEYFKIYQRVFDEYTIHTLIRLRKYFKALDFPISTGKEADVYRATAKDGYVAIKIYRIETTGFKTMWRYVIGDPRFDRLPRTKRMFVATWCRKEFANLKLAYEAGIKVPRPIAFKNNVLIMEYLGDENGYPSKPLTEIENYDGKKLIGALKDYVEKMIRAGIVHGDISEYNIIIHEGEPYLIDWAQAVSIFHPMAKTFLERDLKNIKRMAAEYGIDLGDWPKRIMELFREMRVRGYVP